MTESQDNKAALQALEELRTRLLNLTTNNKLINFRHAKPSYKEPQNLRIIDELPDQLVETLLDGKDMRFLPVPNPSTNELIAEGYIEISQETGQKVSLKKAPTVDEWAKHLSFSTDIEMPEPPENGRENKHSDANIQTLFYPDDLQVRLKNLLKNSESAIQEMGANILYMCFGFLDWFDSETDNARSAPLFLVPVRLHKRRVNPTTKTYEYSLSYSCEGMTSNLSLQEKLRTDFGLELPKMYENTVPETYFKEVKSIIQKQHENWCVRRSITLSLLNFRKLLMYRDLDPERWPEGESIIDHPVVSKFLGGTSDEDESTNSDLGFGEEHLIDELDDIHTKYPLIYDADSSQHSALIDALDSKNLVIEGPPGTGKSQSITNLIAAAMVRGKKVLFIAEKLAALEVVYQRLDSAGLGEFCLELHSHKTQKRKMLDEVKSRIDKHGKHYKPKDIDADIEHYEELKTVLNEHANQINKYWKNTGQTLQEIFMSATRYSMEISINPRELHPDGYNGDNFDKGVQRRLMEKVKNYRDVYQKVAAQLAGDSEIQKHPWFGVQNTDLQFNDIDLVEAAIEKWQNSLHNLNEIRVNIAERIACEQDNIPGSLTEIATLMEELERLPPLNGNELLDRLPVLCGGELEKARQYLELFENIQSRYVALEKKVGPDILHDISGADDFLAGCVQLRQLVAQPVKLQKLADAIKKLTSLQERLSELDELLNEVREVVGERAAKHLLSTESGLTEFKNFVALATALKHSHWQLRHELFDNDELDEVLPNLRGDLEQLHALRSTLQNVFRLDSLTDHTELHQIRESLAAGGAFRWFNSSWRAARRQILGYATGEHVKFSSLQPLIVKAAEFAEKRTKFNNNYRYKKTLNHHLKGLDTDLATLESMRNWYKKVRQQYGRFGGKVSLGESILALPVELARTLRSLAEHEGESQLNDILTDLAIIKPIFLPVSELQSTKTPLAGQDEPITNLLESLDNAQLACGPLASDESITIAELINHAKLLAALKESVAKWEFTDIDKKLFQERLDLIAGINADNQSSLSMFRNTLTIATYVDRMITNKSIQQYIYTHPTEDTFLTLANFAIQLSDTIKAQISQHDAFSQLVKLDTSDWTCQSGDEVNALITRNRRATDNVDTLENWLGYVRIREQVEEKGLVRLAKWVEKGDIDIHQVEAAYKASIYDILAREILQEKPELRIFSGHTQESIQHRFKEYDDQIKNLQRELIAWTIDQIEIPQGKRTARVSERTDLSLLELECKKKARNIPIRELLSRAGRALIALKPCFMMSPISVAQYLVPGQIKFDLIVMDEASQIKPEDALGAVARGDQLVVVGDPKQLPPSNFFDRLVDFDEFIDEDEEFVTAAQQSESILDAALSMFSARRLRWHYRSQHESLIAFSNHSFYDRNLVLFPSPNIQGSSYGIPQPTRVPNGCFIKGGNIEEAKMIAMAIRYHFQKSPEESLGVAAMNKMQSDHIGDAIETLYKEDNSFQMLLDKNLHGSEPLFIKNLENVQGDERDVIFVSMTYGPQQPGGKVFQRFGPINTDMGWRRLNVLCTRAKKRMHIFSSMRSSDIIVDEKSTRGMRALRDFLKYCETGKLQIIEKEGPSGRSPDSDFEVAVMDALFDKGFESTPQFGVAGFFIDVAVKDPGNPHRYLMGIECDGATYHSAKSARDRDRLRQEILENQGWTICRIWSTDWYKNPNAALKPIIRKLNDLKTTPATKDQSENASAKAAPTIKETEKQSDTTESSDRGKQTE